MAPGRARGRRRYIKYLRPKPGLLGHAGGRARILARLLEISLLVIVALLGILLAQSFVPLIAERRIQARETLLSRAMWAARSGVDVAVADPAVWIRAAVSFVLLVLAIAAVLWLMIWMATP